MAYIQARYNKKGELLHYRLFVSDGLDWTGKQRRRYKVWYPEKPGMSQKQLEKAGYEVTKTNLDHHFE